MRRMLFLLLSSLLTSLLLLGCPENEELDDDTSDDDTVDEDCDDADGDGWRDGVDCPAEEQLDCNDEDAKLNWDDEDGDGSTTCGGDCDDDDPTAFPDNPETCDGLDNDCDEDIDEDFDLDGDGYFDEDGDGCGDLYGDLDCDDNDPGTNPAALEECDGADNDCDGDIDEDYDADGDGWTTCGGDCLDDDDTVNPDATEVCDALDNDCDGDTDEDFDADGDGVTTCGGDCDDGDAAIYVGAVELCNGIDDDCDGMVDEDYDADGDGFVDEAGTDCDQAYAADQLDCDDGDATIYPGAPEQCNGIDDDCDGTADDEFDDDDGDGFDSCSDDCDDTDATIYPGATETCNGLDDNCDGTVDEGFDVDGDGWTSCGGDCDDNTVTTYPGATELADGVDNDCDGLVDEANWCNSWEPIEAVGAVKTFDVTYPMFGTGVETVTIEPQSTFEGHDVYPVHVDSDFGVTFDYYVWCDTDGAIVKYGMEGDVSGIGTLTEIEDPYRTVVRPADEVGVVTSWTDNTTITYDMMMTYDFDVTVDYTDLGLESITVAGTTYDALHIHVDYWMQDVSQGYVGDVTGTQDMWFVEDIGIVRFWYTWNNSMITGGVDETLFTKEMTSVTMP